MKPTNYQQSLAYLYGLQKMGIKLGLANITQLLASLGNPERQFASIQVAGSNGKGSTCAYLASILQTAGFKVGLYTSPHLIDFSERIKINGQPIPPGRVVELSGRLRTLVAAAPCFNSGANYPTFFETVTALAFEYFREEKIDIAILETGMGGRLDATNVVNPLLAVITNICLEHQAYLGETLAEIAAEKAGIIKKHTPVLTAVSQPEALECLEQTCRRQEATLHQLQHEVKAHLQQRWPWQVFSLETPSGTLSDLSINLLGNCQLQNALLAIRTAQLLSAEVGWTIGEEAIRKGLAQTQWPGRMQLMATRPWLLLDGAHNPTAIKELLHNLALFPHQHLIVVLGVMEDKDLAGIVSLFGQVDTLIFTRAEISRAASPQQLADTLNNPQGRAIVTENVSEALRQAKALAGKDDLICVTGSLYVVGEAQAALSGAALETIRSVQ